MIDEELLKARLIEENREFRKVFEDHKTCEEALALLKQKDAPTEQDLMKEKELKKIKLTLKDQMYRMMAEYAEKTGRSA